ncbi:MAG: hypothetical protein CK427_16915 [Leptospira sp.]|nr:MAG: hypothetical protein CK427_16915 [Leptospira sp.]
MNDEKFHELDAIGDKLHNKFEELKEKNEFKEIEKEIIKLLKSLPEKYSIEFGFNLGIFDSEREKSIEMYRVGINGFGKDGKTYQFSEGYKFNRYLVQGHIVEIPHNYCPQCWDEWDFKRKGSSCSNCGVMFGKEVKLLIDYNECPNCDGGIVSQKNPNCNKCDFIAEEDLVIWG